MAWRALVVAAVGVIGLAGCSTTRPPVEYPGLVEAGTPREQLCLVRESDRCFVASVGERYVPQYDTNIIAPATYRQLLLPPGKHVLVVYYRQQRNLETVVSGPRLVTIDAKAGDELELRSGVHGADAWFADTLRTANWRPYVVRAGTGETVAIANLDAQ